MKTIEVTLYKFDELPEDVQEKVLEKQYDINVNYEWWEFIYDDANEVGLKITAFDIGRGNYVKMEFVDSAPEVANKIVLNHGEGCDTFKIAKEFLDNYDMLVENHSDGENLEVVAEEKEMEFDDGADELEREFLHDLSEEYRIILEREYEFLTSEDAIKETIQANDYDFTEDGEIY